MAMSSRRLLGSAAAILVLTTGCETVHDNGSTDPAFGEASRYNAALLTIDPDPRPAAGAAAAGSNGAVGAAVARRYRLGTVKQVETITTTKPSSGSSTGPN